MKKFAWVALALCFAAFPAFADSAPGLKDPLNLNLPLPSLLNPKRPAEATPENPGQPENPEQPEAPETPAQLPSPTPTEGPVFSQEALDWDDAMIAEVARARESKAEGDEWRDSLVFASPVMDYAWLLERNDRLDLVERIRTLSATNNGAELAIVTLPSLRGGDSKDFATRLFEHWGIGAKGKDNGVLFLIAVEERRVEIEPGLGYEGALPDGKCGRLLDRAVVPALKQDNWKAGIFGGAEALLAVMSGEDFNKAVGRGENTMGKLLGWGIVALVFGLPLFTILRSIFRGNNGGGDDSGSGSSGGSHHSSSFRSSPSRSVSVHHGGGGRSRGGGAGRGF